MEKILVTGAGGYIGSVLVPKLLEQGYAVRALDRYFFGKDALTPHEHLEIVQEDSRKITEEHVQGVDAIIDLVAISNDPSGQVFEEATYAINHKSRVNTARLGKEAGVRRYILPSSCSIYGFQDNDIPVAETAPTNPLTAYAKACEKAEQEVLEMADDSYAVVVMRQATVYGYSPRMRFDLAINGMTYGAWKNGTIPLMRDGSQWRPMVHVQDTTDVMCLLLQAPHDLICGQTFNVGSDRNNYQLKALAEEVAEALPREVAIEWYGDPDHRSYRVSFDKIEKVLGWQAKWTAKDGALEVYEALESGKLERSDRTITLNWYQELVKWQKIIREVEMYGGIVNITE